MKHKNAPLKSQKGYTLIELIVVFLMIGIFMAAAAAVTASYMKAFLRVTGIGKTQVAADTVMETIVGELSGAANRKVVGEDGTLSEESLLIAADGKSIRYVNGNGQTVVMDTVKDNGAENSEPDDILHLHYLEIEADEDGEGSAAADWYIDRSAYQGSAIQDLTFSVIDGKPELMRVNLIMEYKNTGYTMESSRIVELYNMKPAGGYGQD